MTTATISPDIDVVTGKTRVQLAQKYKLKLHNRVTAIGFGAVLTHVGVLVVVALYYAITQVHYDIFGWTFGMKSWWDSHVTPSSLRHNIRDVGEYVLGGVLAKAVMWNHFTKGHEKAGRVFDFLHDRLHIPVAISSLLAFILLAGGMFVAGSYILDAFHYHLTSPHPSGSLWDRTATIWNSNYDRKALAFVCAFAGSRPLHDMFDDLQGYFAGRRAARRLEKRPAFTHPLARLVADFRRRKPHLAPKAFKNRYNYLLDNPMAQRTYSRAVSFFMTFGVIVGLSLAIWGYYILTEIA